MSTTKKINQNEKEVINDAVRLSKSDFISLYVAELGYEENNSSDAWHLIRASKKGQALAKTLKVKVDVPSKVEIESIKTKVKEEKPSVEVTTDLVIGSDIEFTTRSKEKLSGKVLKVIIGTDNKEYVKIKLPDGKIALKRTNAL